MKVTAMRIQEPTETKTSMPAFEGPHTSGLGMICPCQRVGIREKHFTVGYITISSRLFGTHNEGCPYHRPESRTIPKRRFYMAINRNRLHYGQASIFNFITSVGTFFTRVLCGVQVYRDYDYEAPGFKRLKIAQDRILCIYYSRSVQQCRQVLDDLYSELRNDFNCNRSWEGVQWQNGTTLLHVSFIDITADDLDTLLTAGSNLLRIFFGIYGI